MKWNLALLPELCKAESLCASERIKKFCMHFEVSPLTAMNVLAVLSLCKEWAVNRYGVDSAPYLLSESSLKVFFSDLEIDEFRKAIIALDLSKLIYRFPAARKFQYMDQGPVQLRANSWGEFLLSENLTWKGRYAGTVESVLQRDAEKYDELFHILYSKTPNYSAVRLINEMLIVKMVN